MLGWKQFFSAARPAASVDAFWHWFVRHEPYYRLKQWAPQAFLEEALVQLHPFDPCLKLLVGSPPGGPLELIVTADGDLALFALVFELVAAAPVLEGWKFTALKPPMGMDDVHIEMDGHEFSTHVLHFYAETDERFPDEVSLVLAHPCYNKAEDDLFQSGGMVYLENSLGELETALRIDRYRVGLPPADSSLLIPMARLPAYLLWREKEIVAAHTDEEPSPVQEQWRVMEASDKEGRPLLASFNRGYRHWTHKHQYPWIVVVELGYEGNEQGWPLQQGWGRLQQQEDEVLAQLPWQDYIVIGRRTYNHLRLLYFYARDYWPVSLALNRYRRGLEGRCDMSFYIGRDRYWRAASGFF